MACLNKNTVHPRPIDILAPTPASSCQAHERVDLPEPPERLERLRSSTSWRLERLRSSASWRLVAVLISSTLAGRTSTPCDAGQLK